MKITQLTDVQIAKLDDYREKWIRIGRSTELANRAEAEKGIFEAYQIAGLPAPNIVWCESPLGACTELLKSSSVDSAVYSAVDSAVGSAVRSVVRSVVRSAVDSAVYSAVYSAVDSAVGSAVYSAVGSVVRSAVDSAVYSAVGSAVYSAVYFNFCYGQHDASWLGYYEYYHDSCGLVAETQKLQGLWRIAKNAGWFLPYRHICFIAERHTALQFNDRGQLHCSDGLAIGYPDGWGVYALNGVRMDSWHVLTPPEKLESRKILTVENVEQRRELIRKIGIERFVTQCGAKVMSEQGDYQLLDVWLSDDMPHARFLKMRNPSVGLYHIEGVHPNCATIQQAINWRAGDIDQEWTPTILT